MKPTSCISIINRLTNSVFRNLKLLAFVSRRSYCSQIQFSAEEIEDSDQFTGVIHDKDLLRRTPNGNLLALELIDRGSMDSDIRLYMELLKRCTVQRKLREGKSVYSHLMASRFHGNTVLQNTVINMYAKCGEMATARKVFDEMPEPDMVSFTMLITGYSQCNAFEEALQVFVDMLNLGFMPNEFTFGSALKSAGGINNAAIGKGIHGACVKYGNTENVYVGSVLVDMYARCRLKNDAKLIFDGMKNKNEVSWNALIAAYARDGEGDNAVKLFMEMKREGFQPNDFTYSSIFAACASGGSSEQGKWVHADLLKSGMRLAGFVGHTLLDMYGKAGSIEEARKVFRHLKKKDVVSWNSMLTAYALHGLGNEVVDLFEEMRGNGFQPNSITFLCVLNACSHAGLLDKGFHYFELMKKYKLEPGIMHYVTIVDLLGRAGQLDRAMRFIQEMLIPPTAAIWKALLGACRMQKNVELGVYAAERCFELDPHDSGPHMLLSNMYASSGRLTDAAKVRKMMKETGVKKELACSWVEIGNVVHKFVANDDSHAQRDKIRRTWKKLNEEIQKMGYVPDTSQVFWYSDEEEKEERLQHHSEKLALAFALDSTPSGAPITIKKNIRVCTDCHTAFKYVSKLRNREIILRDTNRFHRFSNGSCSCRDYW